MCVDMRFFCVCVFLCFIASLLIIFFGYYCLGIVEARSQYTAWWWFLLLVHGACCLSGNPYGVSNEDMTRSCLGLSLASFSFFSLPSSISCPTFQTVKLFDLVILLLLLRVSGMKNEDIFFLGSLMSLELGIVFQEWEVISIMPFFGKHIIAFF